MIKKYLRKIINECLLEMKITSVKVIHNNPGKIEVQIDNCTIISGGCSVEMIGNENEDD